MPILITGRLTQLASLLVPPLKNFKIPTSLSIVSQIAKDLNRVQFIPTASGTFKDLCRVWLNAKVEATYLQGFIDASLFSLPLQQKIQKAWLNSSPILEEAIPFDTISYAYFDKEGIPCSVSIGYAKNNPKEWEATVIRGTTEPETARVYHITQESLAFSPYETFSGSCKALFLSLLNSDEVREVFQDALSDTGHFYPRKLKMLPLTDHRLPFELIQAAEWCYRIFRDKKNYNFLTEKIFSSILEQDGLVQNGAEIDQFWIQQSIRNFLLEETSQSLVELLKKDPHLAYFSMNYRPLRSKISQFENGQKHNKMLFFLGLFVAAACLTLGFAFAIMNIAALDTHPLFLTLPILVLSICNLYSALKTLDYLIQFIRCLFTPTPVTKAARIYERSLLSETSFFSHYDNFCKNEESKGITPSSPAGGRCPNGG